MTLWILQERRKGKIEFLKYVTEKCEHGCDGKCTLFEKCTFPLCEYFVTEEEC